jgi:hypothetical protein
MQTKPRKKRKPADHSGGSTFGSSVNSKSQAVSFKRLSEVASLQSSLGVRRIERVGNFNRQFQRLRERERLTCDLVLERHPIEIFHDDKGLVPTPADFVDRAYIGMIQRRRCSCLTTETFEGLRVLGQLFRQEFQGDEAAKLGVLSLVHHTHPAAAQLFENDVMGDSSAD